MKRLAAKRKAVCALGTAVLLAVLSVQTAVAAPEQEAKPSLTIQAHNGGKGIPGLEWSAYQVAEMPRNGEYTLTTAFAASGLDVESLDGSTADEMGKSAAKMVSFVRDNQIDADKTAETNKDGTARLEDMEKGLYLILQSDDRNPDVLVKSQPFFVSLPMMKQINGTLDWQAHVTAVPKLEITVPGTEPTTSEPTTSEPTTSEPSTSEPSTSEPATSEPSTSEPSTSEPATSEPSTSEPAETQPTESQPIETQPPETKPPTYDPGHPGGSPGGNSGGGPGGGNTVTITDLPTPLASFLPPQTPEETGLIEIEDGPVPLGDFPFVPKMGDMGTGGYVAGMLLSLLLGRGAFIRRKKYTGEES